MMVEIIVANFLCSAEANLEVGSGYVFISREMVQQGILIFGSEMCITKQASLLTR
jgi:hypothetical protein